MIYRGLVVGGVYSTKNSWGWYCWFLLFYYFWYWYWYWYGYQLRCLKTVIPAEAGIYPGIYMDSRLRGNDELALITK